MEKARTVTRTTMGHRIRAKATRSRQTNPHRAQKRQPGDMLQSQGRTIAPRRQKTWRGQTEKRRISQQQIKRDGINAKNSE